jgi:hypothetical protein
MSRHRICGSLANLVGSNKEFASRSCGWLAKHRLRNPLRMESAIAESLTYPNTVPKCLP